MSTPTEALLEALAGVYDPELRKPITELGMVESAVVENGTAAVKVLLTIEGCPLRTTIEQDVREAAEAVDGVESVQVEIGYMNADQRADLRKNLGHTKKNPFAEKNTLTRVFAVVSGKGGVGKSSMTANLAAAFASQGLGVGIVDADVHGFSIPGLMGISQPPTRMDDMILPPVVEAPQNPEKPGSGTAATPSFVKVISIGMFVEGNQPVAWRGPMLHRALEQFLTDVHFGALDVLLLDLPPGTGDIALSMAQLLPNAELVLVSTPQHAAVDVAERAGTLSLQTKQKVAGVIENMAAMVMPDGSRMEVFGSGGGEQLSSRLTETLDYEVPLLGSVPLEMELRTGGDEGMPIVWGRPDSAAAREIKEIARKLSHQQRGLAGKSLPLNF
ncbi:P-loop NTPase [Rothia aerolata]|uniref:Iron-sulfur cluster carrier protein n=1 Tax=Rothia aerolata TaxID=1812262 RepID=A0A917IQN7_9MICC|nr:P-loop NTPase [Rothia aerolata]GGH59846.1 iron-sulfur cluster carrier protein [Rothia aerolata]